MAVTFSRTCRSDTAGGSRSARAWPHASRSRHRRVGWDRAGAGPAARRRRPPRRARRTLDRPARGPRRRAARRLGRHRRPRHTRWGGRALVAAVPDVDVLGEQRRRRRLLAVRRRRPGEVGDDGPAQRGQPHRADAGLPAGDARPRIGADHEPRLDGGVPARPADGRLLRHQGLRAVVQRGARRGGARQRRHGDGAVPGPDGERLPGRSRPPRVQAGAGPDAADVGRGRGERLPGDAARRRRRTCRGCATSCWRRRSASPHDRSCAASSTASSRHDRTARPSACGEVLRSLGCAFRTVSGSESLGRGGDRHDHACAPVDDRQRRAGRAAGRARTAGPRAGRRVRHVGGQGRRRRRGARRRRAGRRERHGRSRRGAGHRRRRRAAHAAAVARPR